jgi:hypothetical protein
VGVLLRPVQDFEAEPGLIRSLWQPHFSRCRLLDEGRSWHPLMGCSWPLLALIRFEPYSFCAAPEQRSITGFCFLPLRAQSIFDERVSATGVGPFLFESFNAILYAA